ncbi:MAG TPA: hypothetical protein VFX15_12180 [Actinomycetes bacterium]|nr:hypothetical protein [Actinomycetes bacterium]
MTPVVHLHIGEPKSGTTYLQAILEENRAVLESAGLVTPGKRMQIRAAQDAIRGTSDGELWRKLADELLSWPGPNALISMETLCRAAPPAVKKAVEAFHGADVRVHLTVRDVLRSLPAQWQQTTQHRKTWSWSEYSTAVMTHDGSHPATNNFWSQHDLEKILKRWVKVVGVQNVCVVTVPQPGAAPMLLWQRFAEALALPEVDVTPPQQSNESLGQVSAELMRRVNVAIEPLQFSEKQYNQAVRAILARDVLAPRRAKEPKVLPPESARPWADRESERLIEAVRASGVRVVGDLEDLRPHASGYAPNATEPNDTELLDAAMDAVRGLVQNLANT